MLVGAKSLKRVSARVDALAILLVKEQGLDVVQLHGMLGGLILAARHGRVGSDLHGGWVWRSAVHVSCAADDEVRNVNTDRGEKAEVAHAT